MLPSSVVPSQPDRRGRRRRPCRQLWKTRQRRPALDCGQLWLPSSPLKGTRGRRLHPQQRPRRHRHARRSAWSLPWDASLYTNKLQRRRCKTWGKEGCALVSPSAPIAPFLYCRSGRRGVNGEEMQAPTRLPTTGAISAVGPARPQGFACARDTPRRILLSRPLHRLTLSERHARPCTSFYATLLHKFFFLMHHRWLHVLYSFPCLPPEWGLGHAAYAGPDTQA